MNTGTKIAAGIAVASLVATGVLSDREADKAVRDKIERREAIQSEDFQRALRELNKQLKANKGRYYSKEGRPEIKNEPR